MNLKLEATHTFRFVTSKFSTGAVFDATGTPTCEVLEEGTDTAILTPTVVKPTGTGEYRVPVAMTAANTFEAGKVYNVQISATVDGVAGTAYIATFKLDAVEMDDLSTSTAVAAIPTTMVGTDNAALAADLTANKAVVDAIKVATDKLTFTDGTNVDVAVKKLNATTLNGDGSATPWGP